jgi:hypothetical protein
MPRINLDQIRGLPDILSTDNFTFNIGTVPSASAISDDTQVFLKCQQAIYPGTGNEVFDVPLAGFVVKMRGRKTFPRQLTVTYVEDRSMSTSLLFEGWLEYMTGTLTGNSAGYKASYAIDGATLTEYDTVGNSIKTAVFYGLVPSDKPDIQHDGSSSQLMMVQMTFMYDYWLPSGITVTNPANS